MCIKMRERNLMTFAIENLQAQQTAVAVKIAEFHRMISLRQGFLTHNLTRRMCSVIVHYHFLVNHQCTSIV